MTTIGPASKRWLGKRSEFDKAGRFLELMKYKVEKCLVHVKSYEYAAINCF
jgi:hypothetical protein